MALTLLQLQEQLKAHQQQYQSTTNGSAGNTANSNSGTTTTAGDGSSSASRGTPAVFRNSIAQASASHQAHSVSFSPDKDSASNQQYNVDYEPSYGAPPRGRANNNSNNGNSNINSNSYSNSSVNSNPLRHSVGASVGGANNSKLQSMELDIRRSVGSLLSASSGGAAAAAALAATTSSTTSSSVTSSTSLANQLQLQDAKLHHSKDDNGKSIQIFSFRFNAWENIQLVDYEPNRGFHKCRYADGTIQWLDLKKKPIRAIPLDGDGDKER
jgi:hypothetical protein